MLSICSQKWQTSSRKEKCRPRFVETESIVRASETWRKQEKLILFLGQEAHTKS